MEVGAKGLSVCFSYITRLGLLQLEAAQFPVFRMTAFAGSVPVYTPVCRM